MSNTRKISYMQAIDMVNIILKGKLFKKPDDILKKWDELNYIDAKEKESVDIELSNEDFLKLAILAHRKDITLNELINDILADYVMHKTDI